MADSVGANVSCYAKTKQVQMNMFHIFGGMLMQEIDGKWGSRG